MGAVGKISTSIYIVNMNFSKFISLKGITRQRSIFEA
jgi:hypothetical protein